MKRIIALALVLAVVVAGVIYSRNQEDTSKVLRLVTWSGYFPPEFLEEFTKKTGIKVELSYISSNEELLAKLKAGARGYDIIQPSDYMVEHMVLLNMLQPLDRSKLPHISAVEDYYLNLPYDPGLKYTVPFVRGTTGILVNTQVVKVPQGELTWDFLLHSPDPKHTSLLDDMREVFSAVLYKMGKSPNTEDGPTLEAAAREINQVKGNIALFSSEPQTLMLRGDITIAHAFSTHGVQIEPENPNIKYFLPKGGNSVWTDNFAIPVGSKKIEYAHQFIDYFLDPVNAKYIVEINRLATPNRIARAQLAPSVRNNLLLYPSEDLLKRMVFLRVMGNEGLSTMSRLWTEIKS